MNYPRCGDCVFSATFVKECNDVSYVVGEGVGLTVHKESVVIEEIEEVELISRRAQFIYDRNYDRNAVMHQAQGGHTICLCSRLLFYSKCTGFTVCFTYSDISLAVYINQ